MTSIVTQQDQPVATPAAQQPAEAHEMNGGMEKIGAFCGFYGEQVRYALRLIADGRASDFLWDGCDEGVETGFEVALQ